MNATPEQIAKLPKWAQDHIKDVERERFVAVRALNEFCDTQTKSQFYTEESVCSGERQGPSTKRKYIQAIAIIAAWRGVELRVDANDYGQSGPGIRLSWNATDGGDVALIPYSHNSMRLVQTEDMR